MVLAQRTADQVEEFNRLRHQLVQTRRNARLGVMQVARRIGRTGAWVRQMESMEADPTLSDLRAYAVAVGVRIDFHVTPQQEVAHV